MSFKGVDFAFRPPSSSIVAFATALRRQGFRFVVRYLSHDPAKNLASYEITAYKAAGIEIVTVFEDTGDRALAGGSAGVSDATYARSLLRGLKAPGGFGAAPVYFALDFDMQANEETRCLSYLRGASQVFGIGSTGVYGGLAAVKDFQQNTRYQWQTVAWSGGLWQAGAEMRQFADSGQTLGVQWDLDEAEAADFGQWKWPGQPPPGASKDWFFHENGDDPGMTILQSGAGQQTPLAFPPGATEVTFTPTGIAQAEIIFGPGADWKEVADHNGNGLDYSRGPITLPVPSGAYPQKDGAVVPGAWGWGKVRRVDSGGASVRADVTVPPVAAAASAGAAAEIPAGGGV